VAGTSAPSSLIRAPKQMAARVPVLDLGPGRQGVPGGQRQHQLRARLLIHLQSEDLTETRNAAAVVQYGIAADLKLQAVQGSLEGEAAPVDRGGEREDGRLDFPARRTETVQLPVDAQRDVHRRIRANRRILSTHPSRVIATPGAGSYKGNVVAQASERGSDGRRT
jgi:hypothetical protein